MRRMMLLAQFHGGEDQVLRTLGEAAGFRLAATLERYPGAPWIHETL